MKKHYVKVLNGAVVEGPLLLSDDGTKSPNSAWRTEQLKTHGYFLVDLSHDPISQEIDFANPIISSNSVIYTIKEKPLSEVLNYCRKTVMRGIVRKANEIVLDKHPIHKQIMAALLMTDASYMTNLKSDLKAVFDSVEEAKANLNNLNTRQDIENYKHIFPTI